MDYIYLGTRSSAKIEKQKILDILKEIIDADNADVDLKQLCDKYKISTQQRFGVENFLLNNCVINESDIFKTYRVFAEIFQQEVQQGEFDSEKFVFPNKKSEKKYGSPLNAYKIQIKFGIGYEYAVQIMECLDRGGLLVKDEAQNYYLNSETSIVDEA